MHYSLRRFYPAGLIKRWDDLADSPTTWLGLYFVLNLSLTLYNKSILIGFPFPYTLTAVHALCGAIGTFLWLRQISSSSASAITSNPSKLLEYSHHDWPSLSGGQLFVLLLFSFLYTINIVVSNASLKLVTVPVSRHFSGGFKEDYRLTFELVPSSRTGIDAIFHCNIFGCAVE